MKNISELSIAMATIDDAQTIHRLMIDVYNSMENKELFVCDDLEFVTNHIEKNGFVAVATIENQIIASLIVRYPGINDDNLGYDIGINNEELSFVCHIESVVVSDKYRGMGVFEKMLSFAIDKADKKYIHLLGTVSPDNPASYKVFEKLGFENIMTKEKYGGKLRRIYYKCNK